MFNVIRPDRPSEKERDGVWIVADGKCAGVDIRGRSNLYSGLDYDSKFVGGKFGTVGNRRQKADAQEIKFAFEVGSGRVESEGGKIVSMLFGTGKTRGMEK